MDNAIGIFIGLALFMVRLFGLLGVIWLLVKLRPVRWVRRLLGGE